MPTIDVGVADNAWRVLTDGSGELRILYKDRLKEIISPKQPHAELIEAMAYALDYKQKWIAQLNRERDERKPAFYTVQAEYNGKLIYLESYSASSPEIVAVKVRDQAHAKEGFTGTAQERLEELGWKIVPVYTD